MLVFQNSFYTHVWHIENKPECDGGVGSGSFTMVKQQGGVLIITAASEQDLEPV